MPTTKFSIPTPKSTSWTAPPWTPPALPDVDADIREGGRIDVHCAVSDDNDLLALSFAYDDNWVVTVNGEEVQPSALFGGLLGVSLPQGDCTVTLRYTHPGVVPGAAASLAALAAALAWWFAERRRSQNA